MTSKLRCYADESFIKHLSLPMSIKDIHTKEILLYNKEEAEIWGLAKKGLVGMTSNDIFSYTIPVNTKDSEVKKIAENERTALSNTYQSTYTQIVLDSQGFVRVRQKITTPALGKNNQFIALSSLFIELTQHTHPLHLLQFYRKFYQNSDAVRMISKYFKLHHYFKKCLTVRELSTLLAMTCSIEDNHLSDLLHTTIQSACARQTALKKKLKKPITLDKVLACLKDTLYRSSLLVNSENSDKE